MADARICDQNLSTQERRSMGLGAYKEPELCPACNSKFFDLISGSEFGKIL